MNRADAFGLAQLYQLRGRVGRSTQKAFCTFLVPPDKALTETAMKRLRAHRRVRRAGERASRWPCATWRSAAPGNILGKEQSGHVVAVGFEMYVRLVEEAVRELRGLPLEERPEPRLTTDVDAFLPDDYVEDAEEKVAFYKRLADASEADEVERLAAELRDRFGRLAAPAQAPVRPAPGGSWARNHGSPRFRSGGIRSSSNLRRRPAPEAMRGWMKRITIPVEFATSGRFAMKAQGRLAEALDLGVPPCRRAPAVAAGKRSIMKRWMGVAILVGSLAILTAGDVIDRIAAVVNDEVILLSEVDEKLFILDSQGQLAGRTPARFARLRATSSTG